MRAKYRTQCTLRIERAAGSAVLSAGEGLGVCRLFRRPTLDFKRPSNGVGKRQRRRSADKAGSRPYFRHPTTFTLKTITGRRRSVRPEVGGN